MKAFAAKVVAWLRGKKTYLGLIGATLYAFVVAAGIVENSEYVWGLIVLWTGVAFRSALN